MLSETYKTTGLANRTRFTVRNYTCNIFCQIRSRSPARGHRFSSVRPDSTHVFYAFEPSRGCYRVTVSPVRSGVETHTCRPDVLYFSTKYHFRCPRRLLVNEHDKKIENRLQISYAICGAGRITRINRRNPRRETPRKRYETQWTPAR